MGSEERTGEETGDAPKPNQGPQVVRGTTGHFAFWSEGKIRMVSLLVDFVAMVS